MSINVENRDEFAGNAAQDKFSAIKSNPKLIGGLVGAVVVGGLLLSLAGGGSTGTVTKAILSAGQAVTLENPNGGLSQVTAGPGMMSSSVSEEDTDQSICTASSGTHGTVEEQQVIDMLSYVKVKISDGDCQGKTGWTSAMNVKAGS